MFICFHLKIKSDLSWLFYSVIYSIERLTQQFFLRIWFFQVNICEVNYFIVLTKIHNSFEQMF